MPQHCCRTDSNGWKPARDYQTCGLYKPPDTCRFAGPNDYRCTMPVGTTTALIIRTMKMYGIPYKMVLIDRGVFGLHLDVVITAQHMPQLVALFSMEDLRLIAHNLEAEENAIYEAFTAELGVLYDTKPSRYDRRQQIGQLAARILEEDAFESGEVYMTMARPETTTRRTRPFVDFLRRLHGFGPEKPDTSDIPSIPLEMPTLVQGPRRNRDVHNAYDRLRLKRRHNGRRRSEPSREKRHTVTTTPPAAQPSASATTAPQYDWTNTVRKTWL